MLQNKEAEAKEELKRRAKQLEMQRREQQKRATSGLGGGGSSYLGSMTSYTSVSRYETPDFSTAAAAAASRFAQTSLPAPSRAPAFKGTGMKLGSKKTKQAELLDAVGGDLLASTELAEASASVAPIASEPVPIVQKVTGRGSLPEVEEKGYVVSFFCIYFRSMLMIF